MTIRQVARPHVFCWPDGKERSRLDLSPITAGFSCSKSIAAPAGRFQLTLAPSLTRWPRSVASVLDLERIIRPQALVSIGFEEPGGIGLYLVDEVRRTMSLAGGQVQDALTVSGQDLGKLLAQDTIVRALIAGSDQPEFIEQVGKVTTSENGLIKNVGAPWGPNTANGRIFAGATVRDVANWLLTVGPSMTIPVLQALGGSGEPGGIGGFLQLELTEGWNDGRIQVDTVPASFQGTYWNFLLSVLDRDFYELWTDTVPRRDASGIPEARLVIRPKPFDEPGLTFLQIQEDPQNSWDSLFTRIDGHRAHTIPLERVFAVNLGVSDADVMSYYITVSQWDPAGHPGSAAEGLGFPAVDLFALRQHGVRPYQSRLSLLSSDIRSKQAEDKETTLLKLNEVNEFRNRIVNWYRCADRFEAGSITVAGHDRYRVGDPVELPWRVPMRGLANVGADPFDPMRYYTVAMTHSWSFGDCYQCTLNLTRGHNRSVLQQYLNEVLDLGRELGTNVPMIAWTGVGARSGTVEIILPRGSG